VVAGKTGTSSDTRDSWFAGFTGSYVAVAWVGYDDNRATGLTGAAGALPVWADTLAKLRSASFEPVAPELVEDRWVGYADGLETTPACSADAVLLSLPLGTALPGKPDCIASSPTSVPPASVPPASVGDKIKSWLKHITH
jgi:penicillin-binding protein 1B